MQATNLQTCKEEQQINKLKREVNKMATFTQTVTSAYGTCDNDLFTKMLQRGDVTSEGISKHVGEVIKVTGYADTHISYEGESDRLILDTNKGYLHTSSTVFADGLTDYIGSGVQYFRIVTQKAKKGTVYKAQPVLNPQDAIDVIPNDDVEEINIDDMYN